MSTLTLKTKMFDIVLINVHAPTDDKKIFYIILEDVLSTLRDQVKLIVGNFNAKVRREQFYRNIIGNHSLHAISNNNGTKLINFAVEKGLIIKSTMFPREDIYKYLWISPNGKYKNQIDNVLFNSRFMNSLRNIKALRGADLDSDNLLVGIWIKVKLKRNKKRCIANTERFDIDKLVDQLLFKEFDNKIEDDPVKTHTGVDGD